MKLNKTKNTATTNAFVSHSGVFEFLMISDFVTDTCELP
ncbi:hypothetical protein Lp90_0834 [Lactiplantibacillus plantarum]|uniref:Uncharacterized protein n=2 Tax=Lactiplantibacillus plantarum TaxID=1590 RepID=A0AAW3RBF7_LACPN|nr:hypothetical protein LPLWJ_02140 [Lactiplantibacillus plantarum WJL]KEZ15023.1 hypothetical protein Lp90_0834 [Lactiplantibacillus plantarum]KPN44148.1 hypothetical protein WJL_1225 [Lactiplantibacillus plantarum WJL]KZT87874.1 hypothetical protein Nizo1840_0673 [Lactiplantibacillus plantarum]KZU32935.1 hypothetical protein Nizo2535_1232 [Lactiplantibacillus plantarum]